MFQFPRLALLRKGVTIISDGRVSPFGHPGLIACVPLPLAYRSLPRPSSPPCAQASSTCLRSLDYIVRSKQSTRVSIRTNNKKRNCRHCDDSLPTIYTNFRCQTALWRHMPIRVTPKEHRDGHVCLPLSNRDRREGLCESSDDS